MSASTAAVPELRTFPLNRMYARFVMCKVSRTLWSVIRMPSPLLLSRAMISWMSPTAIGRSRVGHQKSEGRGEHDLPAARREKDDRQQGKAIGDGGGAFAQNEKH